MSPLKGEFSPTGQKSEKHSSRPIRNQAFYVVSCRWRGHGARKCGPPLGAARSLQMVARGKTATWPYNHKEIKSANYQCAPKEEPQSQVRTIALNQHLDFCQARLNTWILESPEMLLLLTTEVVR